MKTQIIQLESFDDHVSIRDKMNWSKTPRILLVFPKRRRVRLNTLDLTLLQRHAVGLGAQLGLVSHSFRIKRIAAELGIPVFGSSLEAQKNVWASSQASTRARRRKARRNLRAAGEEFHPREKKWRKNLAVRLIAFTFGVAAVLAIAIAFVPRASIHIQPETRAQSITIPVRANASVSDVFLSGSVPAQTVSVILGGERSLPASGRIDIPAQAAHGKMLFRNLTDLAVLIPAGTIISTGGDNPVRFETMEDGVADGVVDATVSVPVRAVIFGESGNLDPNLLQAIEGELGLWLAATNPEPTLGGADETVAAPTIDDREELREVLLFAFYQQAEDEIQAALAPNALIFPDTLSSAKILDESYNPPVGEPAERLTLTMRVEFSIEFAAEDDLRELAKSALAASLPSGHISVPNSLTFEPVSELDTSYLGTTSWQMRITQTLRPDVSDNQVIWLVQGRTPEAAIDRLNENLTLSAPPQVYIFPEWWLWLPVAPFRIDVVVR